MGGVATKEDSGDIHSAAGFGSFGKSVTSPNSGSGDKNVNNNRDETTQISKKFEAAQQITEDVAENETEEEEGVEQEPFDPNNYDPKKFGPVLPNGEINWDCPCLGGAAHGPCGTEFRAAFSCFHFRYFSLSYLIYRGKW